MTRAQLIDRIARRHGLTRKTSGEITDFVLDVVAEVITAPLEREWCGVEVLRRVRALKASNK